MPNPFGFAHARLPQAVQPVRGQIEHITIPLPIGEETGIVHVFHHEIIQKLWPNLIGALADGRADGGPDVGALCAQRFHCVQRRLQHTIQRPAPARMGGTDHACLWVRKQHRLAIRRQDPQRDTRLIGDHAITGTDVLFGVGYDRDIGGMGLVDRQQRIVWQVHCLRHAAAVDRHDFALIR